MRLIDCFTSSLGYCLQVVKNADGENDPSFDSVRTHIISQLDSLLGYSFDGGYTKEQYDIALFSVVSFIDEALIGSKWKNGKVWSKNLLQKHYFGTSNGGVIFFQKLDQLNPFNPAERDIREVYYYCLTLGFVGKFYGTGEQSKLEAIKLENFKLLAENAAKEDVLFPTAYAKKKEEGKVNVSKDFAPLFYGGPILLLAFAYFFFKKDLISLANFLVISV